MLKVTKFTYVPVGDHFFDEYNAKFVKINKSTAKFVEGGDYYEGEVDTFEPDAKVVIFETPENNP